MKKTYKIEVDCANCANKMEQAAKKTPGVADATVNYMKTQLGSMGLKASIAMVASKVVDAEGNEKFALIKVSIPRGSRNGDGGYDAYDGYAAAEDWKLVLAERADKVAKRKEKAERAEKEKERKRNARKVVKSLNEKGLNAMIHEGE